MDALAALTPASEAYATLPVAEAFDWTDVARQLGDGEWYLVVFRSIRRIAADEVRLAEFDDQAHLDAAASPGFVHYFKGPAASDRSCLSFCMWTSRAEARAAAGRPAHIEAVSVLGEMYERYTLEFLRVTGRAGAPLQFEPYDAPAAPAPTSGSSFGFGLAAPGAAPA
ncbi:MAG TPA: hypothetical protein VM408_01840 [Methylomirabilota bacterium]|nr:hypothetical protein [Methylomirabilota bacterium]